MADLMIGDARFCKNRKPTNIEVSVLAVLSRGVADSLAFDILGSSTVEAVHEKESAEAVSVIASIVAATALYFPGQFFVKEEKQELPPFLGLLKKTRVELYYPVLTAGLNRRAVLAQEGVIHERWCWGVSVGILQVLRWVSPSEAPMEKDVYWRSLVEIITPFFQNIIDVLDVNPMPNQLNACLAEMIADLAKQKSGQFELLVRRMAEQPRRHSSSTGFVYQITKELRDRYWFTRAPIDQDAMIIADKRK